MQTRRWVNRYQTQTLYLGTVLLYIEGVFNIARGTFFALIGAGMLLAGYGIANDKKIAWKLGVGASFLSILMRLTSQDVGFTYIIFSLVFPVALLALLLHPLSREYQKIWFN
ncbi:MAG: hypothetical protein QF837_04225 [Acidimicrobiales bacterium]|nr:hypothetical protein [Acidimicrobiales bacterium]MDP6284763.1 hypothetical protein [Acidimicrobiales bacterium]HJO41597.1 hypothetical protein [Acidimicrobiales bacterium]